MEQTFNYKVNILSFILGSLTIIVALALFQASAMYDFIGTQQDYNNFFCNGNNKISTPDDPDDDS